jgi:hypothetical protein
LSEFLYLTAPSVQITKLTNTVSNMNLSNYLDREAMSEFTSSDSVRFATVRNLLVNENDRLADRLLANIPAENNLMPEIDLLRGELALLQRDSDAARAYWQGILEMADAPEWVIARAEELLNEQN